MQAQRPSPRIAPEQRLTSGGGLITRSHHRGGSVWSNPTREVGRRPIAIRLRSHSIHGDLPPWTALPLRPPHFCGERDVCGCLSICLNNDITRFIMTSCQTLHQGSWTIPEWCRWSASSFYLQEATCLNLTKTS